MLLKTDKTRSVNTSTVKRQFIFLVSILLVVSIGVFSCEGPVGPEGPQGPPGPPGAVGPAGADGNMMLAGEGPPSSDLGEPGDFYLNLINGDLYGPKDGQGWGEPVNLSGADGEDGADGQDGQDGADGSQIYAGEGPPDAELGSEGDYFLDKTNFHLYGPKTDEGWGSPIELQGPEGPPGTDGVSGLQRIVQHETIGPGVILTVTVQCPEGKVPVGGGFQATSSVVSVFQSYPTTNQWVVRGQNTHEFLNAGLGAFVLCVYAE
jgi:hypothetical protein